jgi:putative RNA 2'-phosphotransferase
MKSDQVKLGKFISLILRHHPEVISITLDHHGYADVQALIDGINATGKYHIDQVLLEEIVKNNDKQRYSFDETHTKIRANQGHSIPVDVELEEKKPPHVLYHGTGEKYVTSIDKQGLLPKSRLYVHLSGDVATAKKVGSRHGKPVIYEIDCDAMVKDGYVFYYSVNHIYLTKKVPVKYLHKLK